MCAKEIRLKGNMSIDEKDLRTLFESTGIAMAIIEENNTISFINEEFERTSGYSRNEIEGKKSWTDLIDIDEDELERTRNYYELRLKNPESAPKNLDLRFKFRQGQEIAALATISVIPGTKKNLVSLQVFSDDRKVQEEIAQIANRLELQIEKMPMGLINWDTEFRVQSWNPATEKIFGFTAEEAIGKHPNELILPVASQPQIENILRQLLDEDTTIECESENITKDGRTIICQWSHTPLRTADDSVIGVFSIVHDVTKQKMVEEEVRLLQKLTMEISLSEDFSSALSVVLRKTCEATGWIYGEAWVPAPGGTFLECSTTSGNTTPELESFRELCRKHTFSQGVGLPGRVWESKQHLWIRDAYEDPVFSWGSLPIEFGLRAAAGVPIMANGEVVAVLNFFLAESKEEDENFVHIITTIASSLGILFQRKRAEEGLKVVYQKLHKTLDDTVKVLSTTTEIRDPYTAGHQVRVASLTCAIAREMGLTEEMIEGIRIGSLLHDLGKIAVPLEILTKPGRITEYEFNIIKTHVQVGYEILRSVDFPWPVAGMALQHHERFDGSGYPNGLKGEDILLEARIIAVADTVEAMASHRPYRPALSLDQTMEEISKNKGVLYDPDIVKYCVRLFTEKGYRL